MFLDTNAGTSLKDTLINNLCVFDFERFDEFEDVMNLLEEYEDLNVIIIIF